jgi:hypothetical protein
MKNLELKPFLRYRFWKMDDLSGCVATYEYKLIEMNEITMDNDEDLHVQGTKKFIIENPTDRMIRVIDLDAIKVEMRVNELESIDFKINFIEPNYIVSMFKSDKVILSCNVPTKDFLIKNYHVQHEDKVTFSYFFEVSVSDILSNEYKQLMCISFEYPKSSDFLETTIEQLTFI